MCNNNFDDIDRSYERERSPGSAWPGPPACLPGPGNETTARLGTVGCLSIGLPPSKKGRDRHFRLQVEFRSRLFPPADRPENVLPTFHPLQAAVDVVEAIGERGGEFSVVFFAITPFLLQAQPDFTMTRI